MKLVWFFNSASLAGIVKKRKYLYKALNSFCQGLAVWTNMESK